MPICSRDGFYNGPSKNKEFFRDDEEVFYCEITKEIFRDYEEYFRHITAINSTVWRCELTGKDNLTYAEALKSERMARKKSDEFKDILRPPTMLVIDEAKQSSLCTLSALTCQFLRKRYFKNEVVRVSTTKSSSSSKNQYTIVDIIASNNQPNSNGVYEEPEQIMYKLKSLNNTSPEVIQPFEKICRQRYEITLEKVQLFIKNNTIRVDGILRPNPEAYKKYVTDRKITFENIFIGKMPEFIPAKGSRQLTLSKQEPQIDPEKLKAEKRAKLLERIEEECTALLTKTDDLERTDQRLLPAYTPVETYLPAKFIGDAFMLKEFFHNFSPILSNIAVFKEHVTLYELSRALSIREVAGPLSDMILILLGTIFHMQRQEEEVCTVYYTKAVQQGEPNRTMSLASKTHFYVKRHFAFKLHQLPLDSMTVSEVLRLHFLSSGAMVANTKAERWRMMCRNGYTSSEDPGLEFRFRYPYILRALKIYAIYQLPFRDIMRILRCLMDQILTYSASINFVEERCEQIHNLLGALKNAQAVENQRLVKVRSNKRSIMNQFNQQCMNDDVKQNMGKRKELEATCNAELNSLMAQSRKEQNQYEQQSDKLTDELFALLTYLGMDRAYRRYYVFDSIPGLFIEHASDPIEYCSENVPKNNTILNDLSVHTSDLPKTRKELSAYLLRMYNEKEKIVLGKAAEDENGKVKSNKENQLNGQVNGLANGITNHHDSNGNKVNDTNVAEPVLPPPTQRQLFMCTGDGSNCLVHGDPQKSGQVRWSYLYKQTDLNALLDSLNPLGIRESELLKQLTTLKKCLNKHLKKCPIDMLSVKPTDMDKFYKIMMADTHRKYNDSNYGFSITNSDLNEVMHSALVERILEFEKDIYTGNLGRLKVKDMKKWREDLLGGNYDSQLKLQWGSFKQTNTTIMSTDDAAVTVTPSGGNESGNGAQGGAQFDTNDINDAAIDESDNDGEEETVGDDGSQFSMKPYVDPGNFLGETLEIDSEDSGEDEISLHESPTLKSSVKQLASALLQVEQAIEFRFFKEPFGPPKNIKNKDFYERMTQRAKNRLRHWEMSLMESVSYSQVFLHLNVLHDCIIWARSTNKSFCKICRGFNDPQKMLLCDECNGGTHMYCLKPIMKTVPEGNWYCRHCVTRLGLKNEGIAKDKNLIAKKRRTFIVDETASSDTSSVISQTRERSKRRTKSLQPNEIQHIVEEVKEEAEEEDIDVGNADDNFDDNENNRDNVAEALDVTRVPNNIDNNSKDDGDNDDSGNISNSNEDESICCVCSYEGSELSCTQCKNSYHLECINLKRPPRYNFICNKCKCQPREYSRKRKSKSTSSDSECDEDENYVIGTKRSRPERHSKRHSNNNNNHSSSNHNSNDNETGSGTSRRSYRRTGDNLPLNNLALYELLDKVMKNEHAWPFLRPVSQAEVPDYYNIIKTPMDFAKVKSKLNMGSYQINEEVMRDIELIFNNCDEYNVKGNEIYQAGAALEKLVISMCKELHLPFKASDMNDGD